MRLRGPGRRVGFLQVIGLLGPLLLSTACTDTGGGIGNGGGNDGSGDPGPVDECIYIPGPGEFEAPARAWWWPFSDVHGTVRRAIDLPDFDQVMSTPVVIRIHRSDARPSVVFPSFRSGGTASVEGVLRAVDGDTGEPLWTLSDPDWRVNALSSAAAGDLDGDGKIEIVIAAWDGTPVGTQAGLVAVGADGRPLWRSPGLFVGWGGPAIADLDADGQAEIVVGNVVLDGRTGRIRCTGGSSGTGSNGVGPLSAVTDVDGDGVQEIVTGNQMYHIEQVADGTDVCRPLWGQLRLRDGSPAPDGFVAVGDIFDDPGVRTTVDRAEIAVVSRGTLRVLDWTGGIVMNPVPLPGGGLGGPPTIADFDGDGRAEIGVAGLGSYTVFKPGRGGNILWTVPTQDQSSSTTGSSVFDFDGNGRAEAVYADECFVHVFDGPTGQEEFRAPNTSCTAYELPVVADVDGDGAAELLVGSNNECSISCPYGSHAVAGMRGLQALKSPSDAWVQSRPVWNQHTYHVTNVEPDGGIPPRPLRPWGQESRNAFRQNWQGEGVFDAPDLTVDDVRLDGTGCPSLLRVTAQVRAGGARGVRSGVPVALYEHLSDGTRQLLGVIRTDRSLAVGESATVTFDWTGPPRVRPATVLVRVDDDGSSTRPRGRHSECREENNESATVEAFCREAG